MSAEIHSIEAFEGVAANSPISLTIPSGISAVYVFWAYYTSTDYAGMGTVTLDSAAPDASHEVATIVATSSASGVWVWYGVAAGSKALAYTKDSATDLRGPTIVAVYVTGGAAWRDVDAANSTGTTAISFSIDSEVGDLVIKGDFSTNSAGSGVSSGWTLLNLENAGLYQQTLSTCDSPGVSSTVCAAENESNSSVIAVSIPEFQYPVESEIGFESEIVAYNEIGQIPQSLGFQSGIDAESDYVFNNLKIGFSAAVDTSENTQNVVSANGIGIGGIADAYLATEQFSFAVGIKGAVDSDYETKHAEENFGLNALIAANREFSRETGEQIGIKCDLDAYNYTAWARANLTVAQKRFVLTLTGSADGLADIDIPMVSFQLRKQSDAPSYLAVVISGTEYSAAIVARQNGEIIVNAVYYVGGVESLRQEIARVDLDTITIDEGPRNKSISLSGYKTVTYHQRTVTLQKATYKRLSGGKYQYRFSDIDLFLCPTDTLVVGDDSFTVGNISCFVSSNQRQMDVFQA